LVKELDGFSEEFLPCYCEDSDLCLRIQEMGYFVYCNPAVTITHHLSKTTAPLNEEFKYRCVAKNLNTLAGKWAQHLERTTLPRVLAFYLPQFHPFPENNSWWGEGFTEWTNVSKAQPNFQGHYQPRRPADLGYYDLRLSEVMVKQAELARSYGVDGFCFYYYWFAGKRLLEFPLEQMLSSNKPDFPFCLCWANENWSRRWDGLNSEILMAQQYSPEDDVAVIKDMCRYFRDHRYIRIDDRPVVLIYRVQLFPSFLQTAARWRAYCREHGIGEIYIAMVESFELVHSQTHPSKYGCDAAVEFPPQELAEPKPPSGTVFNSQFQGSVGDYRDLAVKFATRELPPYVRFKGVMPGWDNTARMQNKSFCFEYATPGAFQAWLEEAIDQTRTQYYGDERLIFVNAWNEWAEGTYLEPDRRYGHGFLEAVRNSKQAAMLLRKEKYSLGG
jgi:lipopolysaccharide biosynthesis protein